MPQFHLTKALELLKKIHFFGIEVEEKYYVIMEANDNATINKFISNQQSFELILDSSNRIESYINELNPLAYDIIDYSEKPIILLSIGGKNVAPSMLSTDSSIQIRVVRDGDIQQLIRKFRMPLVLCALNDEDVYLLDESEILNCVMQDAFLESSLIRLDPNGRVEILRS